MSNNLDKSQFPTCQQNLMNFGYDKCTADLINQFQDEEFKSSSQMSSFFLEAEKSCLQNHPFNIPTSKNTGDKHLDLSCFSGIIGELELSIQ